MADARTVVAGVSLALSLRALTPVPLAAQEPTLDDVLKRTGEYVQSFIRQFAGVVAEETYLQEARSASNILVSSAQSVPYRTLKSDLLMVKPAGSDLYVEFRDVYDVDGRPVRDRQERLTKLFLDPSTTAQQQIQEIATASARYNIGNIYRNINTPILALIFLDPGFQSRFRFRRVSEQNPGLARAGDREGGVQSKPFAIPRDAWVIEYREVQKGTLIRRSGSSSDQPSRGRFWIDPATGRVLLSELVVDDPQLRCTIDVSFQSEAVAGLLVPVEMRERYVNLRDKSTTTGTATYSNFRRFQVQVEEDIPAPPPAPPPPGA